MVLAAERLAIEEPHPAFLARADEELPSPVVERHRRDVHVQIARPHPVGVRRREVVDELQLLVVVEPGADDGVAEALGLRTEIRVAGHHVDDAFGRHRRAAAAPHAAACRDERARLASRQVVRVERVRNAAAALCRGRIDHAIDDVQGIGLAVGRQELVGRGDVGTVGRVDLVKPPVPPDRVDRVLPWRDLFHRRHRRLAAKAERVVDGLVGGRERALVSLLPEQLAAGDVDAEQIVGDAGDDRTSRAPRAVVTRSAISGEKRLCISRGLLSSLTFHSSFMSLTLASVKTFSSFIQPVRPGSLPSVK